MINWKNIIKRCEKVEYDMDIIFSFEGMVQDVRKFHFSHISIRDT